MENIKLYVTGDYALEVIRNLATSQGMYGRMLSCLEENDKIDDFKEWVESKRFKDEIEMIMELEG